MRLFHVIILRHLARHRVRTAIAIVSIALGIAAVLAIQLASAGAVRGFERALESLAGRAALEITQSPRGVDERLLPALSWLQDYGRVTPIIQGEAIYVARDGTQELLTVLGVDILTDLAFRDYAFAATDRGSRPESTREILSLLTDPQSVVLTQTFADAHGLEVGDVVRFGMGSEARRELRVRGLLSNQGAARAMDGNVILMDIAAAQYALDRLGYIDRLEIRLDDTSRARLDAVEAEIARKLGAVDGDDVNGGSAAARGDSAVDDGAAVDGSGVVRGGAVVDGGAVVGGNSVADAGGFTVQRPARRGRQVEKMLAAFHANLTALSAIALIVGMFLVYNSVSTSVLDRRQEIGMLRAVGTSRATIFALFLGEALVLAVPGCVLGLLLGRVLAQGAVALTSATVSRLYIATAAAPPSLDVWQISLAFLVGIPLALLSAAAPAREAAAIAPTEAIRHAASDVSANRRRARWIVAVASFGGAAWLSTWGPIDALPIGGYLAAFLIIVGTTALTMTMFAGAARMAVRVFRRVFIVECWLATHNLVEYARRLSVSVAALAVSLAMTVAIAVMVSSFRETVVYWVQQTLVADLFIGPMARRAGAHDATVPIDVEQTVRAHPAIAAVDAFRMLTVPYEGTPIFVSSGDYAVLLDRGRLLFKSPSTPRAMEAMRAAIGRDEVVVSEAFSLRHHARVGDAIALPTAHGAHAFRIVAIYYDYTNDRGTVALDRATFARHFGEGRPVSLTVYLKDGADAETVRRDLSRAFGVEQRMSIFTNAALRAEVLRIFDATFAITWALELIAITVAVLGIVATLITVIVERRRELAMLRLIGASRGQVQRMVVSEAALLGGISQLLGLGVGLVLSLVLIYVINVQSFGWSIQFHVPYGFLAQLSLVLVIATAIAGLYPARRAARTFLTEQVGDE